MRMPCQIAVLRQVVGGFGLVALSLLGLPAQATDYAFPGNLPSVCSGTVSPYSCGVLTIVAGDTISFDSLTPVVVNFTGAFTSGNNTKVNAAGTTLTLNVTGALAVGDDSILNANVNSIGAATIGARSLVGGDLAATTSTGVITVGASTRVVGLISTDAGAVNLGAAAEVGGGITTMAGVVTVGAAAKIGGSVHTEAGAITVGNGTTICGDVGSTGAGIVSLTLNVKVGGSINTTEGAITVLSGSAISGNAISSNGGVLTLTGTLVGGRISTAGAAITLTDSHIRGTALPVSLITATNSTIEDSTLTLAPVVCTSVIPSVPASTFECLQTSLSYSNLTSLVGARNPLYTQLAGTAFAFDVLALKADGTVETAFVASSSAKNLMLELVEGAGTTACAARLPLTGSQLLGFSASDAGRKTAASVVVSNAYANLRCRVTDANQTPSVVSCSSDSFAVRPVAFVLGQNTPTRNAGSTFTLQATALKSDLTVATLYTAVPTLNLGQIRGVPGFILAALAPQALPAGVNGSSSAAFTYDEVGSFTLPADGAARPESYGVFDSSYTQVDGSTDCVANSASNTLDSSGKYGCLIGQSAALTVGRFYPDHFDITSAFAPACVAGKFSYMDQPFTLAYTVTAKSLARIAPSFPGNKALALYSGGQLHVVALNAGSDWVSRLSPKMASAFLPTWSKGSYTPSSTGISFTRPTAAPDATWGPLDALNIGVAVDDADGVAFASGVATFDGPTPTACLKPGSTTCWKYFSLTAGPTALRLGRLKLSNAYGSERLPLAMPLAFEYWTSNGWVKNSLDTCTTLSSSNFSFVFPPGTAATPNGLVACDSALTVTGSAPAYTLTLSKPSTGKPGWADLTLNLGATVAGAQCTAVPSPGLPVQQAAATANMPWLQTNASDPSARATFGIFKSPLIYRRENY